MTVIIDGRSSAISENNIVHDVVVHHRRYFDHRLPTKIKIK